MSKHHIKPRGRGGRNRHNIVHLPEGFHRAYHILFQSLTLEEAHVFLDIIMRPGYEWSNQDLSDVRKHLSGGQSS